MNLPNLPATGRCRCGRVRFHATSAPLFTSACHCRGCQQMTGSAFSLSAAIPDYGFELVGGETVPGGADHAYGHRFCGHCLSWVCTKSPRMQGFLNVRAPMFDDAGWIRPYLETWMEERLPFVQSGALRSFDRYPGLEMLPALLADYAAWARG
ncbi:MAG: GFA family protein [Paracoccaceae bacterium]